MRFSPWILVSLACLSCSRTPPAPEAATSATASTAAVSEGAEAACERGTARLLGSLREPMEITVWATPGAPEVGAIRRALDDLLGRYERLAPGKLRHVSVAVTTDEQRAQAKDAGLQEVVLGERAAGSPGGVPGFLGVSFKYRKQKDAIPALSPDQPWGLEFWVGNKIRELRDRADETRLRIGVVTGKDEIKLTDANLVPSQGKPGPTLKGVMEQALPSYRFEDVDLQGGAASIDGGLRALVITQPGSDYTEPELVQIDRFLMRGDKAAVFYTSAVNLKASDPTMRATLGTHGLGKLLDGYGVELKRDAIFDLGSDGVVKAKTAGGEISIRNPAIARVVHDPRAAADEQPLDNRAPAFFRIVDAVFPFSSTLVLHPERQPGARVSAVARTSAKAATFTSDTVVMNPEHLGAPDGAPSRRVIAAAIEGELRSAFGGAAKAKVRILVISSSQFLANPYARAGNPPPNPPGSRLAPIPGDESLQMLSQFYASQYLTGTILVFKNTLDWAGAEEDLVACSALLVAKRRQSHVAE